jgi:hypothetical protein
MKFFKWFKRSTPPEEHVRIARELSRQWNNSRRRFREIDGQLVMFEDRVTVKGRNIIAHVDNHFMPPEWRDEWRKQLALAAAAYGAEQQTITLRKVESAFNVVELVLPPGMCKEEIGDALEQIHRMVLSSGGCPKWRVWLKVVSTCSWVLVNSVRQVSSAILGKKAE